MSASFRHRSFIGRHPWRVLAVWGIFATSAVMLNGAYGGASTENFSIPGAESQRAADALEDRFPQQTLYTSSIVFHSPDGLERGPARHGHHAGRLPPDSRRPRGRRRRSLRSRSVDTEPRRDDRPRDRRLRLPGIGVEEFEDAEAAVQEVSDAGVQVEYDGALGYANPAAEPSSEMIAIAAAVVVLLIAFGSVVATSLPIVAALTAILTGSSLIRILSAPIPCRRSPRGRADAGSGCRHRLRLFVLARHRQNLDQGCPCRQAIGRANATAGLSVVFAGVTVVVAIAGMQISGIPMTPWSGWRVGADGGGNDARGHHPLPRSSALPQGAGSQPSDFVHPPEARLRPQFQSGAVGGNGGAQARALSRSRRRSFSHPDRPGLLDAARVLRRRQRRPATTTRKSYDLISSHMAADSTAPCRSSSTARTAGTVRAGRRGLTEALALRPWRGYRRAPVINEDSGPWPCLT